MTVACFGELLLRLTPPGRDLLARADRLDVHVGGAEANVAVALAALGHTTRFVGAVPAGPLGERALAAMRGAGVDTRSVARSEGRMGLYFLEAGAGLRPSEVLYDREGSAFARISPGSVDFAGAIDGARLLHCGGIAPALGDNGRALAQAAHSAAMQASVPIAFDMNYRASLWAVSPNDPAQVLRGLAADATILFAGRRDIGLLLDQDFADEATAQRAAFDHFPRLQVIATTGRELVSSSHHRLNACVAMRGDSHTTPFEEVTDVIERIGSGDAFAAGVLDGWLHGGDARTLAERGLGLAALKLSLAGDNAPISRQLLDSCTKGVRDVRR